VVPLKAFIPLSALKVLPLTASGKLIAASVPFLLVTRPSAS